MGFSKLLLILPLLVCLVAQESAAESFRCNSPARCESLVGYVAVNTTTISTIQALFGVKKLTSLLGANGLNLSTPGSYMIRQNETIRVPIPCLCFNGNGTSNQVPVYTVQKDDGLYHIAAQVFSNLVTYPEIQRVNNITNANVIEIGQELWIPLPCSCDAAGGNNAVHFAYVVEEKNTAEGIAQRFGSDKDTILEVNGFHNDSELIAGLPINVPLRACNSSVRSDSIDYPLRVANGSYALTANDCVKCQCDSAKNWTLQCESSQLEPSGWTACPSMQCEGSSLYIGNATSSGCNSTNCAYAGYTNQTIFTALVPDSTCPASTPSNGNIASRVHLRWSFLFISIHLVLFCFHIYQQGA